MKRLELSGAERAQQSMREFGAGTAVGARPRRTSRWVNLSATGRPRSSAGAIPLLCAALVPGAGVLPAPAALMVCAVAIGETLKSPARASGQDAVARAEALVPFFGALEKGRVDVVGVGDSNQLFGGHGWDHGWNKALAESVGLYATGLHSAGENSGNSAGVGYRCATISTLSTGAYTYQWWADGPAELLAMAPQATPLNPLILAPGTSTSAAHNLGLQIESQHPVGVNERLRFHGVLAASSEATGSVRPLVRLGQSPWTTLVQSAPVALHGSDGAMLRAAVDIPAAARNAALNFRWTGWGEGLSGPFGALYMRMEALDRRVGASFHTLYGSGGMSARDMAEQFTLTPVSTLAVFLSEVANLDSDGVLIRINTGLNDRNEGLSSVGSGITPGNSPEALEDNLRVIVARMREAWLLTGRPEAHLYFVLTISHPVAPESDGLLALYRESVFELARSLPRTASVRLDMLTTADEMFARGWYQAGGSDQNHLTQSAFEELARREWDQLKASVEAALPADRNRDGVIDFDDFLLFFQCYDTLSVCGDVDRTGTVDLADFLAFFNDFDSGGG